MKLLNKKNKKKLKKKRNPIFEEKISDSAVGSELSDPKYTHNESVITALYNRPIRFTWKS